MEQNTYKSIMFQLIPISFKMISLIFVQKVMITSLLNNMKSIGLYFVSIRIQLNKNNSLIACLENLQSVAFCKDKGIVDVEYE